MNIGILAIFFIIFTTINGFLLQCEKDSDCECSVISAEEIQIVCNTNSTEYIINKSENFTQIFCNNWKEWEDFHYTTKQSSRIFNFLSIKQCGISDRITFKELAKQLGVKEASTLLFQSFKNFGVTLTRWHFQEFSEVTKLILSRNGLTNISNDLFSDLPKLEWLDLSDNSLVLPVDIFDATPNLKRLELAKNRLERIKVEMFNKLQNLEFLDLSKNQLAKFEYRMFHKLVSLKSLNLSRNMFSDLSMGTFYKLKKLETLDISFNNFSLIPSNLFDENKELREVYLHDNNVFLLTLPDNLFANLTKLEEVFLNNNGFTNLPENLFWSSLSLKKIVLENNFLVTLPQNIFRGLWNVVELSVRKNKIFNLPDRVFEYMRQLKVLDMSMNYMVYISKDMFQGVRSLVELNMERNQLKFVDIKAFLPIVNLRIAKFSHNMLKLTYIRKGLSLFYNNEYLTELDLSYNNISYFIDEKWSGNENLKLLNLSHNNISRVTLNSFVIPPHNIQIDLRYNKIKNIYFDHIHGLIFWHDEAGGTGRVILLDHNPLLCDCSLYDILRYREGKMPAIIYNYFNFVLGNLKCSKSNGTEMIEISKLKTDTYMCLEHEYLKTEKKCQIGCTCSIRISEEIRILDCSYRNLSKFIIDKTRVNFVDKYPLILNFTGNFLTEIPSTEVLQPLNIITLLLSNNHITHITSDKFPQSLKWLELHNNNISNIDPEVLLHLKMINMRGMSLSGNPFICDCDAQHIVDFVHDWSKVYGDLINLKCADIDTLMINITKKICPFTRTEILLIVFFVLCILITAFLIPVYIQNFREWFGRPKIHTSVRYRPRQAY